MTKEEFMKKQGRLIAGVRTRYMRYKDQEQLADILGCSRVRVSMIERGKSIINTYELRLLSEYFNVSVDEFMPKE